MKFLNRWIEQLRNRNAQHPEFNLRHEIDQIKNKINESEPEPGRKIHSFEYGVIEIRLDCDITENYRVTVWNGNKRRYSFTVYIEMDESEKLMEAYSEIIGFLETSDKPSDLPDNDLLKGFYYGQSST